MAELNQHAHLQELGGGYVLGLDVLDRPGPARGLGSTQVHLFMNETLRSNVVDLLGSVRGSTQLLLQSLALPCAPLLTNRT
jgi:hypothetical protein